VILKLNEEISEEIKETLTRTNFAKIEYKHNLYFFAKEKVRIPKGVTPMEVFAYLKEKDDLVTEFAEKHAQENNGNFVTIGRSVNLREMAVQGFMVYTYFFSKDKDDTEFPEELFDKTNSHYWVVALSQSSKS